MKKPLPKLTSDEAAERFVDEADLSEFDLSSMTLNTFEFAPKSKQLNMRVSAPLLDAVKRAAAARGMSYQRFIRQAIEQAVQIGR